MVKMGGRLGNHLHARMLSSGRLIKRLFTTGPLAKLGTGNNTEGENASGRSSAVLAQTLSFSLLK